MATNFALDILSCPPSSSIKAIVYTSPTKLAVIEGGNTLLSIDLKDFFVPITNAQQTTFVLPGASSSNVPLQQYSFTYCGLNENSTAKFADFFPSYPSSSVSSTQYLQWAFLNELSDSNLATLAPVIIDNSGSTAGSTGSDTSYQPQLGNSISKVLGSAMGMTATYVYAICTRGGLKLWSEEDPMILFNTYNSDILSNDVKCIATDTIGNVWVGTDNGISALSWAGGSYAFSNFTEDNSPLVNNVVQDMFYLNGILAIATAAGISLYDTVNLTWETFSKYNVNEINVDSFTSVRLDGAYLIAGSESGVYVYNTSSEVWSTYSSNTSGWTLGNYVNRIESYSTEVFVGTTGGIVTFSVGATVCETIPNLLSSSYQNVTGLVYAASAGASGEDLLYVSQGGTLSDGAILAYNVTGATWSFGVTGPTLSTGVTQIALSDQLYFVNSTGFARFATSSYSVESLPLSTQKADLLFSYPENGSFPVSLQQKIYMQFSKPTGASSVQNHFSLKHDGATVSVSLLASANTHMYEATPTENLSYASLYTIAIINGLTATDSTYFRQSLSSSFYSFDKNPVMGWRVMGKQLLLSGAEGNLITPIVFRNPQTFDVNVLALVAV